MKSFIPLVACAWLAGCSTTPPAASVISPTQKVQAVIKANPPPPLPQVVAQATVVTLPPTTVTNVFECTFGPGTADFAFFAVSHSLDDPDWTPFSVVAYPTNGAVLRGTNVTSAPVNFYRAGFSYSE